MADVVVGPLVQNLISLLQTEFTLIGGVEKDVEKLTETLSTIQTVLEDAEAKQVKEKSIADWLNKLKDAAYDAEDALDLWLTTTRQRELQTEYSGLDQKRETGSIISEPKIYGRDNDQKNIIDQLLSNESQEDLSVFPLVGFGGVGKTTLAQLVYNDERVVGRFETRVWVCVSEPFDVKRILKEIIESLQQSCTLQSLQSIQTKVQELLKDKKYLLVLDDVWNENQDEWNKLRCSIKIGDKGSSVVVTTRSPTVASITATITPYRVGVLSDDDCWSLLKHRALGNSGEEQYPNLVPVGKEIAKRCKGVPLAAKSLGSLLYSKTEENHWINVRDNEIWNLKSGEDDILPVLRLSYNHLPSNLKQCFSYCSIFPKDHPINKTNLICLWMANGFIQPKGRMELEEIGDDIFNELLQWSFFQDTREDGYGNIETCKMHDLMHDLASSIARNDCQIVEVNERTDVPKRIRHLTMILESEQSSTAFNPPFLRSVPSLRTLLFLGSPNVDGFVFQRTLRVLDLSCIGMKALPPSVSHLKQLRYLDLSYNDLESLPESICRFVNLQMLDLNWNKGFETLPSSISKLEHLRYLNLSHTKISSLTDSIGNLKNLRHLNLSFTSISSLPDSICRLVNLQVLNLNSNEGFETLPSSIGKLEHLRYLSLSHTKISLTDSIGNLKNLRHLNLSFTSISSLPDSICRLVNLQVLNLNWNEGFETLPSSIGKLEHLRYLSLSLIKISSLPDSICRLRNLWWLDLNYNQEITILPQSIGNLTNLRHLHLYCCTSLESLPENVCDLMNLQSLLLGYCCILKELPKNMKNMRSLIHLDISYCFGLRKLPGGIGELRSLRTLGCFHVVVAVGDDDSDSDRRDGCGSGAAGINELHGLNQLRGRLEIDGLENVRNAVEARMANLRSKQYLTELELWWRYAYGGSLQAISNNMKSQEVLQGLLPLPPNLQKLRINGYGAEEFPPQIFQGEGRGGGVLNTTLQSLGIRNCPKLKSLPAEIGDLAALKSLNISWCEELVSFPKELQKLTSLTKLEISVCPELTALPDAIRHLRMLQKLQIWWLENLRTLPDWLKHLTTLQSLHIRRCHPDLKERCKRDEGEDWHKISHIPYIEIDDDKI